MENNQNVFRQIMYYVLFEKLNSPPAIKFFLGFPSGALYFALFLSTYTYIIISLKRQQI